MALPQYSRVRIVTDRFRSLNVPQGTRGYIIEVYDNEHYEIEVSDPAHEGITVAQFVASESDLIPDEID